MEPTFFSAFKYNPLFFLLAAMAGAAGLVLGVVAIAMKKRTATRIVAAIAAAVGLVAIGCGLLGWSLGKQLVDATVQAPGLTEKDKERLRDAGYTEAGYARTFGLAAGALPIALAALALARSSRRPAS